MKDIVPSALVGERLDRVVALMTGLSRSAVRKVIQENGVYCDESLIFSPTRRVIEGESIEVDLADPEIQKMTLKERIADHRSDAACYSCHARIDPWGIAFENYDALGSYRTKINDKPVDAAAFLFNKQPLEGMNGLKRYLLQERQDQFARAMVRKMTTYALGRPLSFSDHAEVEELAAEFRKKGDRLGDLIYLVTQSGIFNSM